MGFVVADLVRLEVRASGGGRPARTTCWSAPMKRPLLERGLLLILLLGGGVLAGPDAGRARAFLALSHRELDLLALIE